MGTSHQNSKCAKYAKYGQIQYLVQAFGRVKYGWVGRPGKDHAKCTSGASIEPPSKSCNYDVKQDVADQKYGHGKERLWSWKQKQF